MDCWGLGVGGRKTSRESEVGNFENLSRRRSPESGGFFG